MNLYNKRLLAIAAILMLSSVFSALAQVVRDNNVSRADFEREAEKTKEEFTKYAEAAKDTYKEYEKQALAEFSNYVKSIEAVWGNDVRTDTRTEWVEYNSDRTGRSIVDFDSGDITVQVKMNRTEAEDSAAVTTRLTEAVRQLLESKGSSCPYTSAVDVSVPIAQKPILDGIVDLSKYQIPDSKTAHDSRSVQSGKPQPPKPVVKGEKLDISTESKSSTPVPLPKKGQTMAAEKIADAKEQEQETELVAEAIAEQSVKEISVDDQNKNEVTVSIHMSLVEDNLSKNAVLYKDNVEEFSERFRIDPALIFAVMEQESSFNPKATSWVPAYGLMQIVPESGGFDAYLYTYKKEWVPTMSYLFVPRNNIELGTAYLRVLSNQFSDVTEPECRMLCVIAGYNTGAGNVSRAFTGKTNLTKAIPLINKYNYSELYEYLTQNLNTKEARNYVSGVTARREKYLK